MSVAFNEMKLEKEGASYKGKIKCIDEYEVQMIDYLFAKECEFS